MDENELCEEICDELEFHNKSGIWLEEYDPEDFEDDEDSTEYDLWAIAKGTVKGGKAMYITHASEGATEAQAMAEFREFIREHKNRYWEFDKWNFFVMEEHRKVTKRRIDVIISDSLRREE